MTTEEIRQMILDGDVDVSEILSVAINAHREKEEVKVELEIETEVEENDEVIEEETEEKPVKKRNRRKTFPESDYSQTYYYIERDLVKELDEYGLGLGQGAKSYFINRILRKELDSIKSFKEDELKRENLNQE